MCPRYLAVSEGTAKVLGWWISLVTAGQLMKCVILTASEEDMVGKRGGATLTSLDPNALEMIH